MKTITCRQLGGPCELEFHADTADQAIQAQDRHLKDAVASGDVAHEAAHQDMKSRWRHPKRSLGWYRDTKEGFDVLPEDRVR